jgi:hypothetical protein
MRDLNFIVLFFLAFGEYDLTANLHIHFNFVLITPLVKAVNILLKFGRVTITRDFLNILQLSACIDT